MVVSPRFSQVLGRTGQALAGNLWLAKVVDFQQLLVHIVFYFYLNFLMDCLIELSGFQSWLFGNQMWTVPV